MNDCGRTLNLSHFRVKDYVEGAGARLSILSEVIIGIAVRTGVEAEHEGSTEISST
jgi:hypothetical protein